MKRRQFLKAATPVALMPALINGMTINAYGSSPLMQMLSGAASDTDHVLVLIQLSGGNDGLNTIIPLDQYSNLSAARSNILIPDSQVLGLQGTNATGIHPAMTGIRQMFNDGKVRIVQSVGYPDPNFSHFRATDIWLTGADSDEVLTTGWAGRYLNYEYPNFPTGFPNTTMPDPLAIQVGSLVSTAFQGPTINMAFAITDPTSFYNFLNGIEDPAPANCYGKELTYIRTVAQQSQLYADAVKNAANSVTQQATYPSGNNLADQLKIVARLVAGGLKTRLYMVGMGGFDNHSQKVDTADTTKGAHADLLSKVSEAIKAFQDDLQYLNVADRVIGMTFSEFGRRILSNGSLGTDHGAAAPMIIFGNKVQSGILGDNPTIPAGVTDNDNVPMQYDFRSVYASMLKDWFCVPQQDLETILLQNFQTLPLVDSTECAPSLIHDINQAAGTQLITNYPNPFVSSTNIQYTTGGKHTLVQVFSGEGKCIKTLVDDDLKAGTYNISFENTGYGSGVYYARLQNGPVQQVRTMMIAR